LEAKPAPQTHQGHTLATMYRYGHHGAVGMVSPSLWLVAVVMIVGLSSLVSSYQFAYPTPFTYLTPSTANTTAQAGTYPIPKVMFTYLTPLCVVC
jgi:predicted benzoate:H+ symporter BenE